MENRECKLFLLAKREGKKMTKAQMKKIAMTGLIALVAVAVANRIPKISHVVNNH